MDAISISQLKINPAWALSRAADYPVAIKNRQQTRAYLIGKELYEKMISYIEDISDRAAVATTDFRRGRNFEQVAKELGI